MLGAPATTCPEAVEANFAPFLFAGLEIPSTFVAISARFALRSIRWTWGIAIAASTEMIATEIMTSTSVNSLPPRILMPTGSHLPAPLRNP